MGFKKSIITVFPISLLFIAYMGYSKKNSYNDSDNGHHYGQQCGKNNGNHYGHDYHCNKDKYTDDSYSSGVGNLILNNVKITSWDVTDAKVDHKSKTYEIGTFCAYRNSKKYSKMNLIVTNNENGFIMKKQGSRSNKYDVPYSLRINSQRILYDTRFSLKAEGDNSYNCNRPEYIYLTIDAASLAAAKSGTYDVSFNIGSSSY